MTTALRCLAAVIAATVATFVLLIAVELFSAVVHPFPPDFGGTEEEMCRHVERYPQWVLAVAVPLWGLTAFAGTWIAGWLGNRGCAIFIGLLILAGLAGNLWMLPYPIWFKIACLIAIPGAIALGVHAARRRGAVTAGITG